MMLADRTSVPIIHRLFLNTRVRLTLHLRKFPAILLRHTARLHEPKPLVFGELAGMDPRTSLPVAPQATIADLPLADHIFGEAALALLA